MRAVAVAAVPFVLAIAVTLGLRPRLPLGGDEPHYLIIADSVLSDRDLDLKNNYLRDFDTHRIYGLVTPHVYNIPRGWMPYHMPGLGILLAIPLGVGGVLGARVAMVLMAALVPFTLMVWLGERVPFRAAAWLVAGLTLAYPFVFDGSQIYPDMPAGVIATVTTIWLIREAKPGNRRLWSWTLFWVAVGALPWLHVKYLGIVGVLFAAGLIAGRRARRAGDSLGPMLLSTVAVLGVASFVAYNLWAFGRPLGVRDARELTTSAGRAAEMFLGLHLDQSQGMFFQNPLLLAGVAAFAAFARLRPRTALFWVALYASAIVPNSLEAARFGGGGPVGRFGWTAAWLWTIPLGVAARHYWREVERYITPAVVVSVLYQSALAARWLRTPAVLFPAFDPPRDSPFPDVLRPWLPSFYFWDFSSYWRFVPNVVALAVVLAVALAGLTAIAARSRPVESLAVHPR